MSNNTPRRSQRLATQHDTNPYNVAARKALNKLKRQQARPYNEYNQAVNNLANPNHPVQPAHKSVIPTEMKDIIMHEYGMTSALTTTQDITSESTTSQEPTASLVQNASSSSSPANTTINVSVT